MNTDKLHLSANARTILKFIAEGYSYEQILSSSTEFTYLDIFKAASEALQVDDHNSSAYHRRLSEIRRSHPRAYEKWNPEEDARLAELFGAGADLQEITLELQRQKGAIISRLRKLGFTVDA